MKPFTLLIILLLGGTCQALRAQDAIVRAGKVLYYEPWTVRDRQSFRYIATLCNQLIKKYPGSHDLFLVPEMSSSAPKYRLFVNHPSPDPDQDPPHPSVWYQQLPGIRIRIYEDSLDAPRVLALLEYALIHYQEVSALEPDEQTLEEIIRHPMSRLVAEVMERK